MLIPLDDLSSRLKERFGRSGFDLTDTQLVQPGVSVNVVRVAEERLGVKFPIRFSQLLERFDFSRLSLANLYFEYGHDLQKLIESNLGRPIPWWGAGARPQNLLLIGTTDGHAIFLSINDGKVIATEKGGLSKKSDMFVAEDFEQLVRMAGSLALAHSKDERIRIASEISERPFWAQLASGTA